MTEHPTSKRHATDSPIDCDWEVLNQMILTGAVRLSELQRKIAYLRALRYTYSQIGDALGSTKQAVRGNLVAIHNKYRKALENGYSMVSDS